MTGRPNPFVDLAPLPIIGAPMANVGGGLLAAAISRAGGLGFAGFGGADGPDAVAREFDLAAGAPIGAGFMAWALDRDDAPLRAALERRPAVVSITFGALDRHVALVREAGIPVVTQVGDLDDLAAAERAGVDGVVARGGEGGGHGRDSIAMLPLLQAVLERTALPVAAAGGIATRRGVAAVLAAGASAAWIGTRFAAAVESRSSDRNRALLVAAGPGDTVHSRVHDIAKQDAWPVEFGGRALREPLHDEWLGREDELAAIAPIPCSPVYAGQGVGAIRAVEPAAAIVAALAPEHSAGSA
ncbi:MAG: nitronate monooxygenase [Microbacteriaceae bacterium]|nr:nitronate monooxygenase [Microbacteriaceae bacterium]